MCHNSGTETRSKNVWTKSDRVWSEMPHTVGVNTCFNYVGWLYQPQYVHSPTFSVLYIQNSKTGLGGQQSHVIQEGRMCWNPL